MCNTVGLILSSCVIKMGIDYLSKGQKYDLSVVRTVQALYFLELVISFLGITRQGLLPSLLQTCSRVFISNWGCTDSHKTPTAALFVAWGLSDTLRFLYYIFPFIKKIRYWSSFFLYPLGVGLETYLLLMKNNYVSLIGLMVYIPGFIYLFRKVKRRVL